jgi:hypothetical protein
LRTGKPVSFSKTPGQDVTDSRAMVCGAVQMRST